MGTGVFRRRTRYTPARLKRRRFGPTVAPVGNTITPSVPVAYQMFQRDAAGRADIPVSGSYTGSPSAIEVSFTGGAYTTAVAAPAAGTYAGKKPLAATGAGAVVVRHANDTSANATVTPVQVGDVWVIYGQSNVGGRGDNPQDYAGPSGYGSKLYTSNVPALLAEPSAIDSLSTSGNSPWSLLGTAIADAGVPVQIVARAASGTGITGFLSGTSPYTTMRTAVRVVTTAPRVIYWQGENDALAEMSAATYYGYLVSLAVSIRADLGCNLWVIKLQNCTGASAGMAAIWATQDRAFAECPYITQACDLSDITADDGFHLKDDAKIAAVASRIFAGMQVAGHYVSSGGGSAVFNPLGAGIIRGLSL